MSVFAAYLGMYKWDVLTYLCSVGISLRDKSGCVMKKHQHILQISLRLLLSVESINMPDV